MEILPNGLELDYEIYEAIRQTIKRDIRVLNSFKIMDYRWNHRIFAKFSKGIFMNYLVCLLEFIMSLSTKKKRNSLRPL